MLVTGESPEQGRDGSASLLGAQGEWNWGWKGQPAQGFGGNGQETARAVAVATLSAKAVLP